MPFQKGHSGNPAGRPKRDPAELPAALSLRSALEKVCRNNPELLQEAMKRLLQGSRSALGMLELAAKLNRELVDEQQGNKIAIVFTGTLDSSMLRANAKVIECPVELKPVAETNASSLTTNQDRFQSSLLKTEPSVADYTARLEQENQPQE